MRYECLNRLLTSAQKYYPDIKILVADDSPKDLFEEIDQKIRINKKSSSQILRKNDQSADFNFSKADIKYKTFINKIHVITKKSYPQYSSFQMFINIECPNIQDGFQDELLLFLKVPFQIIIYQ